MYKFYLLVLVFCFLSSIKVLAYQGKIAFDLDETLIESCELDKDALIKAKKLGYKVQKSSQGQDFIVRPGAQELLSYAKEQGFSFMILTHNRPDYAADILNSSGLMQFFDEVRSMADCKKVYNLDFSSYPYHRNRVHQAAQPNLQKYLSVFYDGYIVNSWKRFQGNSNIHPYLPCVNCDKYPPLYGARVLFDNSNYNVEDSLDFAGIKVEPFYANKIESFNVQNQEYDWVTKIKRDLDYLKENTWQDFYRLKFNKDPIDSKVDIIKS